MPGCFRPPVGGLFRPVPVWGIERPALPLVTAKLVAQCALAQLNSVLPFVCRCFCLCFCLCLSVSLSVSCQCPFVRSCTHIGQHTRHPSTHGTHSTHSRQARTARTQAHTHACWSLWKSACFCIPMRSNDCPAGCVHVANCAQCKRAANDVFASSQVEGEDVDNVLLMRSAGAMTQTYRVLLFIVWKTHQTSRCALDDCKE